MIAAVPYSPVAAGRGGRSPADRASQSKGRSPMSRHQRILLTGATGSLGRELRAFLAERCDRLRSTDRVHFDPIADNEEVVVGDLGDAETMRVATRDVDVIVHMAGVSTENTFEAILGANIAGFYALFEAARRNRVKRIVWASSVHAVGFHDKTEVLRPDCPTRPDSLYGVSKVFGEGLAQYYWDKFGLETVSIRIGSCFPEPTNWRMLSTWLSYDDLRHLIDRCLIVPRVRHAIVWGASNNTQAIWDNTPVAWLGYRPQDDAERFREKLENAGPPPACDDPKLALQGGHFATAPHYED
jgi:uronate dehydrogenase